MRPKLTKKRRQDIEKVTQFANKMFPKGEGEDVINSPILFRALGWIFECCDEMHDGVAMTYFKEGQGDYWDQKRIDSEDWS